MPRAAYILCAHSAAQDGDTSLLSVFELVEKLQITPFPKVEPGDKTPIIMYQPLRIIATWMVEPDDDLDSDYEYEFHIIRPEGESPIPLNKGNIRVEQGRSFCRFNLRLDGPLPISRPGILRAEGRFRRVGSEEWVVQDYPMIVEQIPSPTANRSPS